MRLGVTADHLPSAYRRAHATSSRWHVTAEVCRDIARAAQQHGAGALFILIPELLQVAPEEFARYVDGLGIDPDSVDLDQPTVLLLRALRAEGLNVVDPLPVMRRAARSRTDRLYGEVDHHLSPGGHELLTGAVLPEALRLLVR